MARTFTKILGITHGTRTTRSSTRTPVRCYRMALRNATRRLSVSIGRPRVMCPHKKRDNSFTVLKRLCVMMPRGLIVFDRGFNRRAVFTELLSQKHHIFCRARSNAVFFHLPKQPKKQKRGRPRRYGTVCICHILHIEICLLRVKHFQSQIKSSKVFFCSYYIVVQTFSLCIFRGALRHLQADSVVKILGEGICYTPSIANFIQ